MARRIESKIDTRTQRLKLTPRGAPYHFTTVDAGVALGYRRVTSGDGRWVVRAADGQGSSWQQVLDGVADDFQTADGTHVLTFMQAAAQARARVRGGKDTGADTRRDKPLTIREALLAYQAEQHDARNAKRVLIHLPEWLAVMPVAAAEQKDFRQFVKLMLANGLKPASVKRTCKNFSAALVMASRDDDRITNERAWRSGFEIKGQGSAGGRAINYASDTEILAVVAACQEVDPALGLFVEIAAQTGARPIQIARLQIVSLQANPPRLMMPASNKGQKDNKPPTPLPITQDLGERLRRVAHGRRITEPLLLQSNGEPWCATVDGVLLMAWAYRDGRFDAITARLGLPADFTFYGLRHSSIIRQLQKNVPTRIVAAAHDTSVQTIESFYGSYILDYSDELIRAALLETSPTPPAGNVIKLRS